MTVIFIILIVLASIVLGMIVLVQNPKGGGLAGNIAGFSNQFMGVKQTTDVLEKGTWIFATLVALLCIFSALFIPKTNAKNNGLLDQLNTKQNPTAPAPANQGTQPLVPAPAPANNQPAAPQK